MEDAAQAVAFVARQRQRGAAVRARLGHETDPSVGGAEGHEVLAEQPDPLGRPVRL